MKKNLISFIIISSLFTMLNPFTTVVANAKEATNKTAVVLGGGGSRGSYQVGVWKALKELGISYDIVTGASIGSINAVLMATDDYATALAMWENITEDKVFADKGSANDEKLLEYLTSSNMQDILIVLNGWVNGPRDVTPFSNLLKDNIDTEKLLTSDITWGTYVIDYYGSKVKEITQYTVDSEDLDSYILASSSPYPVFPLVNIDGTSYMDGGYYDALPIDLATKLGASNIIAIDISPAVTPSSKVNKDNITYIKPDWDLGSFLDFDSEQALKNIAYGYNDTMQQYGVYDGFKYTFYKDYSDRSASGKALKNSINPLLNKTIYDSTNGYLNMNDYYLRCAEVSAETLNLEPTLIYNIDDLNSIILSNYQNNSLVNYLLKNIKIGIPLTTYFVTTHPMESITALYLNFLQNSQ